MVKEGTFREDLYYRICEMIINLPPLRDREGDKILLARHMLTRMAKDQNSNITGFTPEATQAIESYTWPGNIREMENKIKRAVIMCEEKMIAPFDLAISTGEDLSINLRQVRQNAEITAIQKAISISDNNYSAAAKLLGITRPTLYDLIKKYNIN
jgi:two-component system NtrC family response regulator